ncbi:hypothetical protein N658DRAFT_413855 [Parathielavia hyrcaniae]|uniref:Single-strand DNA deaminase toxin A-like C-terminal domain-containing protein n=1 Tax=Parathielavia hyrcaniae TaxID=113614 RepID=A0AAN6T7C5_9PEZI|nr:hypothetical protein N658DRAFT_413855 [Parathielavia hyrcaniae]
MNPARESALKALRLSTLHIAVSLGRKRRVVEILTDDVKKELMDARDADGSTPLMAAVLTGRLSIARLFLRNGASDRARDLRGCTALAYSQARLSDKKLRRYQSAGLPRVSQRQQRKRKKIAKILRYPPFWSHGFHRAGEHEFSQTNFLKNSRKVLRPYLRFKPGKDNLERATFGFITSATKTEVKVGATSGWQPNPKRSANVLGNLKYFHVVREVSRLLASTLKQSPRDNSGKPLPEHSGRWAACHVEEKFAAFWVIAALKAVLNSTDVRRMCELRDAAIPEHWERAWIVLDYEPCGNVSLAHGIQQRSLTVLAS